MAGMSSPTSGWRVEAQKLGVEPRSEAVWVPSPGGSRFCVLVVDVVRGFLGSQSTQAGRIGIGAGTDGDQSVGELAAFVDEVRGVGGDLVSVVFTRPGVELARRTGGTVKRDRLVAASSGPADPMLDWTPALAPLDHEWMIEKAKPSAFAGTALSAHLSHDGRDTVIIAGCTTSGCVRATATDAFSLGFKVLVAEECVFDNSPISGVVSLYDMDRKYADVMGWRQVVKLIRDQAGETDLHATRGVRVGER
jgi:maleamate amidohydrolase